MSDINTTHAMHDALAAAQLEFAAYSCNGVNLFGDRRSIDAAADAFHYAAQLDNLKTNLRHWREECGKLHAQIAQHGDTVKALLPEPAKELGDLESITLTLYVGEIREVLKVARGGGA